jgi:LysR family transcriptional regulator, putative pyruvate carboxylase regulator
MDLNKLRGFYAVVRHGGFTSAARRLHLTQPSVSLQVKLLEREIGSQLLDRNSRKVVLTRDGAALFELAGRLFETEEEIEARFQDRNALSRAHLVIATSQSVAAHILPPRLEVFADRHPGAEITILNMRTGEIIGGVEEGSIDLGAILIDPRRPNLVTRPVLPYEMVLIAPRDHPLSRRRRVELADIVRYPFISYTHDAETRQLIDRPFRDAKLKTSIKMALGSTDLIIKYVSLGYGIAIIHNLNIDEADRENLHVRPLKRYFSRQWVHFIHRGGESLSPAARAFMELF